MNVFLGSHEFILANFQLIFHSVNRNSCLHDFEPTLMDFVTLQMENSFFFPSFFLSIDLIKIVYPSWQQHSTHR